jgi:Arc/MetJ-type ribon-helix-helix transcriptional regulator
MAATEKLSVALGRAEATWVKQRASKLRTSVSAVVTEAVREARQQEARREVLEHLVADSAPPTKAELARVRRELASGR